MTVKLPDNRHSESKWVTIPIGKQDFEIAVRRPGFEDNVRILSAENRPDHVRALIRAVVTDWQGVTGEDDQHIPFSFEALEGLFQVYPQTLKDVYAAAIDVAYVYPEDLAKNSETPPENGGTETTDETDPSIPSSNSGEHSVSESVSESVSVP